MNRISTITTKVRPIKKMFLIEENDIDQLVTLIRSSSKEIAGLSNIILLNNDDLFSTQIKCFVNLHDPDVVINYSTVHDDQLAQFFRIPTYSGNVATSVSQYFSTPFYSVDNLPYPMKIEKSKLHDGVYVAFNENLDLSNPFYMIKMLHFGSVESNLHNPEQIVHQIRSMSSTKSEANHPLIPGHVVHFLSNTRIGGRHQTESFHQRWTDVKQDWSDPEYRVILTSTKNRGGISGTKETDHEKGQRNPAHEVGNGILRPAGGCQSADLPQHSGGLYKEG